MNTSLDTELLTLNVELSELMERGTISARFIELVEDMVVLPAKTPRGVRAKAFVLLKNARDGRVGQMPELFLNLAVSLAADILPRLQYREAEADQPPDAVTNSG